MGALEFVCEISVYDTSIRVSACEPLATELVRGLTNLANSGRREPTGRGRTHRLDVEQRDGVWTVRWDGAKRYRGPEPDMALYDALIALNQHAAKRATELGWTVLHGGAAAIGGRALAVVGHSGAGKSTLTTALTRRNHPFIADEVVAVRDDFTVEPFHRPIGIRRGGAERIGVSFPDGPYAQTLPYHVDGVLGGGEPLAIVAVLRRSDEQVDTEVARLSQAEGLFALANQTLGATDVERNVFRRLERLVRSTPVVELRYHDVDDAVAVLEARAADESTIGAAG